MDHRGSLTNLFFFIINLSDLMADNLSSSYIGLKYPTNIIFQGVGIAQSV
jgi:hypothetical protein